MTNENSRSDTIRRFFLYHFPALLYAALIIILSSIPDLKAPHLNDFQLDKIAHFLEYAIFAFLAYRSITHLSLQIACRKALFLSALFLAGFALVDELYQHYVPGRLTDLLDLTADFFGSAMVLFLLWLRDRTKSK